jgi:hypothetical protein
MDSDEHAVITENNKTYNEFLKNKVGSDSYNERPAQTFNLTQKAKEISYKGYTTRDAQVQATNWDIDDASKTEELSDAVKLKQEYDKSIDSIMIEKLKTPNCLIDAEALASHVSIVTSKSNQEKVGKSGTTSGKSSKMNSSKSALKESTAKSQTSDKLSQTSTS